jgi:hypothetical protein
MATEGKKNRALPQVGMAYSFGEGNMPPDDPIIGLLVTAGLILMGASLVSLLAMVIRAGGRVTQIPKKYVVLYFLLNAIGIALYMTAYVLVGGFSAD